MVRTTKVKITLSESLYERIRRDIISNQLQPGEKINIRELCSRFNTSETPVRLALNRLAADNIIEYLPRQGMRVKTLNLDICEETFNIREMLECYYLSNIVMTLSVNEEMRRQFQKNVSESLKIVSTLTPHSTLDDYLKNYEYDIGFHYLLIKCTGIEMLMEIYQKINPYLYVNYVYSKKSQKRLLAGIQEHQKILEALLQGNAQLAEAHIKTHLSNAKRAIISILKIENIL